MQHFYVYRLNKFRLTSTIVKFQSFFSMKPSDFRASKHVSIENLYNVKTMSRPNRLLLIIPRET